MLINSCHYDSKYFPGQSFQGAVDSAVPCSIMLNAVQTLQPELNAYRTSKDISLMLIFFDGEEAIKNWTRTDSLYGSRHLANQWALKQVGPSKGNLPLKELNKIDVLVLLDLIGAANPTFYSLYPNTSPIYSQLVEIERILGRSKLLNARNYMFLPRETFAGIEDDHTPFLENGVRILHLIPVPFPKVWHKLSDNLQNLDPRSIRNFNRIFRVFVIDYLRFYDGSIAFRF